MNSEFIDRLVETFNITPIVALILTRTVRILLIIVIALVAYIALRYATRILTTHIQRLDQEDDSEFDRRTHTILRFVKSLGIVVIIVTAILTVLDELDINIAPLIASVGVAGLAIGLGAQTLVKDALAGFFILLEDQFHVGDSITVNDISGSVEELNLRTTHLRDLAGTLHVIPNGEIRIVSNHTLDWSRAHLELLVPYEQNIEQVFAVLREVTSQVASNDAVSASLLEPFTITGLEALGDSGVKVRILAKTVAGDQWNIQRILRRKIHKAFTEHNISLAYPRQEVYVVQSNVKVGL